jgi:hypothetical protein
VAKACTEETSGQVVGTDLVRQADLALGSVGVTDLDRLVAQGLADRVEIGLDRQADLALGSVGVTDLDRLVAQEPDHAVVAAGKAGLEAAAVAAHGAAGRVAGMAAATGAAGNDPFDGGAHVRAPIAPGRDAWYTVPRIHGGRR